MPFSGEFKFEWLSDGVNMTLLNDLTYIDKFKNRYTVPTGEQTDGASIPRFLWSVAGSPYSGKYRTAAVIHDYLYRNGYGGTPIVERKRADQIFYEAMLEVGVRKTEALSKFWAVRLFGPKW